MFPRLKVKLKRSNEVIVLKSQEYVDAITVIRQCFALQKILKMTGN